MSYDLDLVDPITKETLQLDESHHMKGGTYQVGGCPYASLNITYNYAPHFYKVLGEKGIRSLYGKTGFESIPILSVAISKLKEDVDEDYWKATEGNAKMALRHLLILSSMKPNGIWQGD